MAISLYSGTPGSYKSYHATADIIQWLGRKKNVIANFPVNASKYYRGRKLQKLGKFVFKPNTELTIDYLLKFARENHKPGKLNAQTLIVIDEASILFNAREFDRKGRMEWVNFFANHRHYNFDVILIAQNDRMLDRQIRGLLEYDIKHRALKNWNFAFALLSFFFKGIFHAVEYWYPCKLKTSTSLKKFNKRIAACYDTMALFNFKNDGTSTSDESPITSKNAISTGSFFKNSKIREVYKSETEAKKIV